MMIALWRPLFPDRPDVCCVKRSDGMVSIIGDGKPFSPDEMAKITGCRTRADDRPDDRPVYIYLIEQVGHAVKIGMSADPDARCRDLQAATATQLRVIETIQCPNRKEARRVEREMHLECRHLRIAGEWFRMEAADIFRLRGKKVTT